MTTKTKPKVLLIGWDAADWKIIGPLLAKGQMPALKSLIDRGVYGNMSTMNPPYSPMLWSTVATGKTPDKHGVLGFIEVMPDLKGVRPVTTNSRKSRALWNIFHNQGLKSNLVGWWPSYPSEPINGNIVSDKFQKVNKDPQVKNPIIDGVVHPKSLVNEIKDLRLFPYEITEAHILPFIPDAVKVNQDKDRSLQTFAKMIAENVSIHSAGTYLQNHTDWDFMAVYYDLIDHFCHAFMKYHPPRLKAIPQEYYDLYKDCIVGAYRFQDMMLDRTLSLADDDTTIIVMSDHGYESGNKRILKMPKVNAAPAMEHRQFGIFVAAGPNIKHNEKVFGLGLIDVCPTILHMYDLPVGKDMAGKVALDIFKNPKSPKYIDSWETVEGDFGELNKDNDIDQLSDQEAMQQLVDLGYIERPDEKIENAIIKTTCDLKHNLGRVYKGKKDFQKATEIFLGLVRNTYPIITQKDIDTHKKENPKSKKFEGLVAGDPIIDVSPYYLELLDLAIRQKHYDEAEDFLKMIHKTNKRLSINTTVHEANILIGKGMPRKALQKLYKALESKSSSNFWYLVGKIHMQFEEFEEAKIAFEQALSFEVDTAKYQQALADSLLRLGQYEDAADHALVAVELVKYFPEAHYTLGEALEKLGDLDNAKIAYETANNLKPKTHYRSKTALENIKNQLADESTLKFYDNQIVVISGLPRSGTSLMMQMIHKGGITALTDDKREADISNPKGYFEYEPVMALHKDNSWLDKAQNKSLKVVAPLLKHLSPKYRYKVIFMGRDLHEVVKSQQKMIGKNTETLPLQLMDTYKKQLESVRIWKDKEPNVELININYKELLETPNEYVEKIIDFIGVDLDRVGMINCIDKSLYRNRA